MRTREIDGNKLMPCQGVYYRAFRRKISGSSHLNSRSNGAVFISIFNDLNEEIKILHNQKAVREEFKYFDDSKKREKKICQYIGIPIKTDRNKIEILLQIDVSKEKALGKNYNELKQFAEYVLLPFCSLLHCSYERDLIFNKFYDILEENIIRKF